MKRVLLAAVIAAAFFLVLHRPASAMAEFCPAQLNYERVGPDSAKDQPGALFGFNLSALGPRTITSAKLAFDTSAGWYTLDVPAMTLVEKDRHYSAPWVTFIRHDYVSPVLYVRFPQSLSIRHAWVYTAAASNDGAFGWQAQGTVMCDPPAAASPNEVKRLVPGHERHPYVLDPKDEDGLSNAPSRLSLILAASPSKALESSNCAVPFRYATVKRQVTPEYPDSARGAISGESMTSVEVAIRADGSLADAWVWGPSGFTPLDDASVLAARDSTYEGGRAYCKAVPGGYFFRVMFDPNR